MRKRVPLSLIMCHYGGYHELRRAATLATLKELDAQEALPAEAWFLEMTLPSQRPCYEQQDLPSWVRYKRIPGGHENRSLFQKESLWNLGILLSSLGKLLFLDSDCHPVDEPRYFQKVHDAIKPGHLLHPLQRMKYEKWNEKQWFNSVLYATLHPELRDKAPIFPGLGYGLVRDDILCGFNPWGITGSGDAIMLWERCPKVHYPMSHSRRFYHSIMRPSLGKLEPAYVPGVDMLHRYHGPEYARAYKNSRVLIDLFGLPMSYCHIDGKGLMAWNDPESLLAILCGDKSQMSNPKDPRNPQHLIDYISRACQTRIAELQDFKVPIKRRDENDYRH